MGRGTDQSGGQVEGRDGGLHCSGDSVNNFIGDGDTGGQGQKTSKYDKCLQILRKKVQKWNSFFFCKKIGPLLSDHKL